MTIFFFAIERTGKLRLGWRYDIL